jgi:sensor histidine kinase YesM
MDIGPDTLDASVPNMILQPLVENAIKHGLSPLPEGGTITIRAHRSGACLRVSVSDDGIGFPKGFGTGVGLANTRARLTALYGAAGHLNLDANPGGGVIAQIELPCEIPDVELAKA